MKSGQATASLTTLEPDAVLEVVAIGLSAGGLQPLKDFLSHLPTLCNWCILVAAHRTAGSDRSLAAILQEQTTLRVNEAIDGQPLTAGQVLVLNPGLQVIRSDAGLTLQTIPDTPHMSMIDGLFKSLAATAVPRCAAVLLSGLGSDGTAGMVALQAACGATAAQDTSEARFPDMPGSAQAAGVVEVVAPARHLPARIEAQLSTKRSASGHGDPPWPVPDPGQLPSVVTGPSRQADALAGVLQRLRGHGGQGFERYKPSTVRRRVERRMVLHGLRDITAYESLLADDPAELGILFKEMLIGVTSFFRDPLVWQALEQHLLPGLAATNAQDTPLRAWCAGCSTGEEAYSLAMTWLDLTAASTSGRRLKIFASDLNKGAVARARRGVYSLDRLQGVSEVRRARHFDIVGQQARVARRVREMVLFACHDLTAAPPFGRLNLLMCRNLLVYLQPSQQQDLIKLFHYCLEPGGLLVLGLSETVGQEAALFEPIVGHPHTFRRCDSPGRSSFARLRYSGWTPPLDKDTRRMTDIDSRVGSLRRQAERLVLERWAPAAILVNVEGDVLWTCGAGMQYLDSSDGRTNVNVHAQALASLRTWISSALRGIQSGGSTHAELRGMSIVEIAPQAVVDITVVPFKEAVGFEGLALIVIERKASYTLISEFSQAEGTGDPARSSLSELHSLQERLRQMKQELQNSIEDFQSANEELQTSNEELTTSREEMQSMNDELQSINAELQAKLDALALEQSDMKNLLESTRIATLFLDADLNVRRFTEQARRIINLRDGDAGRPLSDLTMRLNDPTLVERASEVLRTLSASETEVPSLDGGWFSVRIHPYRTVDNVIAGVVITLTDMTNSDASQSARSIRQAD